MSQSMKMNLTAERLGKVKNILTFDILSNDTLVKISNILESDDENISKESTICIFNIMEEDLDDEAVEISDIMIIVDHGIYEMMINRWANEPGNFTERII